MQGQTAAGEKPATAKQAAAKPGVAKQSATKSVDAFPPKGSFPFDDFENFSAIMVGSVMVGDEREAHIYRFGNLVRTEGSEGLGYFIADLTELQSYGLNPMGCMKDSHMYFRSFPFTVVKPGRTIERKAAAGTETINGHECKIEDVTVTGKDLGKPMELRFWEAQDLNGFPVRVEVKTGKTQARIEYKDVKLGSVDHTLFVRPRACTGKLPQPEEGKTATTTAKPKVAPKADNLPK